MSWELTRRELLKAGFTTAVVGAAGVPLPVLGVEEQQGWRWDKGVCRFCGTGCGIQVATTAGRVVAVRGDPDSPVNRGLLCVKGYALPQIQYAADRLTRPLLRKRAGKFDKRGDFEPVSWQEAFDVMEREWRRVHGELGPTGLAIDGLRPVPHPGGLRRGEARQGRLAHEQPRPERPPLHGLGGHRPHADLRDRRAGRLLRRHRAHRRGGAVGLEHGRDAPHALGAHHRPAAALAEVSDREPHHLLQPLLRGGGPRIVFKPNTDLALWNYLAREVVARGAVDEAYVREHCVFAAAGPADIGFGLRPDDAHAFAAEKDTQLKERVVVLTREEAIGRRLDPAQQHERRQESAATAAAHWLISFDDFKKALAPYTLDFVADLARGDPDEPLETFKAKLRRSPSSTSTAPGRSSRTGPWVSTSTRAAPG